MAQEPPFQEDKPELQAESFTAPLFLQRELLSDQNVLDYFYESKFFDTGSANQRRRKGHRVAEEGEGIEYVLLLSNAAGKGQLMQPPVGYPYNIQNQFGVHLISRVNKRNNVQVPERVYYSISGVIYQAPALQKLVIHKLYKTAITLDKVLSLLTSMCHWNVLSSYNWKAPIDVLSILKDVNGTENDVHRGDCFEDDLLLSSDDDDDNDGTDGPTENQTMAVETSEGVSSGQVGADGNQTAVSGTVHNSRHQPWFRLPSITGSERRPHDDVPLSFKGLRGNRTSVLFNFPPSHSSIVIQNEYEQLFRASQRMANIYVSEAAERPRVETARRDIFVSYHQALDSLELSLLDSYRARKLPSDPPPFFGCNPPVGNPLVDGSAAGDIGAVAPAGDTDASG